MTKVNEVTKSLPHEFPGVELKDMYPIDWAYDDVSPAIHSYRIKFFSNTN